MYKSACPKIIKNEMPGLLHSLTDVSLISKRRGDDMCIQLYNLFERTMVFEQPFVLGMGIEDWRYMPDTAAG
jgi:hypothetical protein